VHQALVTGLPRLLRAGVFVACALALALVAHVAGGAAAPPGAVLGMIGLLMVPAATLLAGRRRRWPGLTAALLATQGALHYGFMTFSAGPVCHAWMGNPASAVIGGGHAGMEMGPMSVMCGVPVSPAVAGGTGAGLWMAVCHLVAAAALAVLLSHGERVLWLLADWLMPRVPAVVRVSEVPAWGAPIESGPGAAPRPPLLPGGIGRRGPPLVVRVPV
jgi:hypothetical protein